MYTFNYRGLQDYSKRRKVFHNLKLIDRDIVYAQETRSDVKDEKKRKKKKKWKNQWGEHTWFTSCT